MEYQDLLDLIKGRRSFRRFRPEPIPRESILKILEAGRHVPSAGNAQPWEFLVVEDKAVKKDITLCITGDSARKLDKDPTLYIEVAVQPHLHTAPVLIVVCGDTRLKRAFPVWLDGDILVRQSLAICVYAMQLAAASLGLATAWATIQKGARETAIKKLLGIPDPYVIDHIIPLGFPDEEKEKSTASLAPVLKRAPLRRDLDEIVHYEHFDMAKFRS
ncbi:MAG: nitroreductase family protein, partial [Desulfatiglandales bacterium]